MRKFLLSLFIIFSLNSSAQKIYGIVFNDKGDLLPYSSVTIKGTTIGASANNRAKYAINVKQGTYIVVCQHIGYATQEKKVTVTDNDEELAFFLSEQKLELKEVTVKSGGEDPAYAIIRQAIKKRPEYSEEVNAFTCDLYTKDMIKLRRLPKRIMGKKVPDADREDMGLDTTGAGIIYLSESTAKVASQQPDKFKLEVTSSRVSGSDGFGFTFPTFISLYQNNVTLFTQKLNPRGFISPIADGALNFYKYKYLGSFWEDGKEVNSIRLTPRRKYEPLFSGIINITENDWHIYSLDLVLTKESQLEIVDTLQITQFHVPVESDTWRVKNQFIHFNFSQLGIDAVGNFVSVYSDYNLQPLFRKGFFDNVVIKYDSGVNKKPKAYWDTIRPVPLEREEARDYIVKDSLLEVHKDSAKSQFAADILNAKQGKINPLDIFWGGINRTHYSKDGAYQWSLNPLIRDMEYNPAEGAVVNISGTYEKYIKNAKTNLFIQPNLRYGFSNKHLNGGLEVILRTRDFEPEGKLKRETWTFAGGRRVTQFNRESPITPLINSITTLFDGNNYMKTYENVFGNIIFSKRYENGLRLSAGALFEDRRPLDNTTLFTFTKKDSMNITPNYPYEKIDEQFTPHKAFIVSIDLSFKPGQKYVQFPDRKVPLGSNYPTFALNYTKGFKNILGSDVNFDKWKFMLYDDLNLKIAGLLKYKVSLGGFFNNKMVPIQDYQHFNGNLTIVAGEYVNSFQLVSYYAFSTNTSFYGEVHLEHHFNGLLTNKIPLFKKLNWHLVAGTNTFFINDKNNHVELFAGIENIFKLFRMDWVAGYDNGKYTGTAFRLGFGGLIGGNMSINRKSNTVSFSF